MPEKIIFVIGVTTLCMLSPGPDMILVMRNALTQGNRIGGLTALGVLTGNTVHIGYCAVGIGMLSSQQPAAYHALRFASALFLFYLGIQGLRSVGGVLSAASHAPAGQRRANAYWHGFLNNLLNPKGILFYVGVFSYLITPDLTLGPVILLVAIMVSVSAAFWVVFLQALQHPALRTLARKHERFVHRTFGVVLILFAIRLAILD